MTQNFSNKISSSSQEYQFESGAKTIPSWLADIAGKNQSAIAISAVDERPSLTYRALLQHIQTIGTQLNSLGLKPGDIVAIALENDADFLTSILSVASVATAFPLNPNQPKTEFQRYFDLLDIKAVIVRRDTSSAICSVANSADIPILELSSNSTIAAGQFSLKGKSIAETNTQIAPKLNDYAVLVGTSGSTGQPKIISLTHESFFVSISHAADWMQLRAGDRSLVLTPLAMLHALVRSSCPLLLRGGEVICTPGYNQGKILDWLDEYKPSFFTGVPSMYRALRERIEVTDWTPQQQSLRFLVTGSDRIDAAGIEAVEKTLKVPLIQFYGMSEVSPLPATSPLPPLVTPPGAVGKINPMWQVACVDDNNQHLPLGEEGEIILRGGYINELIGVTSEQAIHHGWFHTGDLGYFDEAGWLYYTGRVDDRINRAGKKIYAMDVEAVLLTHPKIKEAVVFGIPDSLYGEYIGAALVLHYGAVATTKSIRQFMAKRVADFKIPDKIIVVDALPLNRFGKVKRKTLAAHYGLKNISELQSKEISITANKYVPPRTEIEQKLAAILSDILGLSQIGIDDSFYALGGHSLLTIQLFTLIEEQFERQLPVNTLLEAPTIRQLAQILDKSDSQPWDCLVQLKSGGNKPALFLVHDPEGNVAIYFNLAKNLHSQRPVYGLRPYGREGFPILDWTIEQIVNRYIDRILSIQPEGPYCIGGLCDGGIYAYEVGQQLQARGHQVGFIALLDAIDYEAVRYKYSVDVKKVINRPKYEFYSNLLARNAELPSVLKNKISLRMMLRLAKQGYVPQKFEGELLLFRATAKEYPPIETPQYVRIEDPLFGWGKRATKGVKVYDIPDTHSGILREPNVKLIAERMEIAFSDLDRL